MLDPMKTTAYFRNVVRGKHPGIEDAWILRVIAEPLRERLQADGRHALGACAGSPKPGAQGDYA